MLVKKAEQEDDGKVGEEVRAKSMLAINKQILGFKDFAYHTDTEREERCTKRASVGLAVLVETGRGRLKRVERTERRKG